MSFTNEFSKEFNKHFVFQEKNLILNQDGSLVSRETFLELKENFDHYTAYGEEDYSYYALDLKEGLQIPDCFKIVTIREYFSLHKEKENMLASRARSIVKWRGLMKFCPRCASPLIDSTSFSSRECPSCKEVFFPRIEPCIIVLIYKGDEVLLVRHTYRNQDTYACVAGFIEVGETAENAVIREAREEVGLEVQDVEYRGSQAWPFPDQLMLAFKAQYKSGDIKVQESEISEARWFKRSELPNIPKPGSVAYRLIFDLI